MKITVYCSSKSNLDNKYTSTAVELGHWIGSNKHELVYGGVNAGMMHILAQSAHDAGASIIGIIPQCFTSRADELNDTLETTPGLNERKARMYALADAFVVLPGGLGTIDEWVSTLSALVVDCDTRRKIIVVNIDGIFDDMAAQLNRVAASPFARNSTMDQCYVIVDSITNMINELNNIKNCK